MIPMSPKKGVPAAIPMRRRLWTNPGDWSKSSPHLKWIALVKYSPRSFAIWDIIGILEII